MHRCPSRSPLLARPLVDCTERSTRLQPLFTPTSPQVFFQRLPASRIQDRGERYSPFLFFNNPLSLRIRAHLPHSTSTSTASSSRRKNLPGSKLPGSQHKVLNPGRQSYLDSKTAQVAPADDLRRPLSSQIRAQEADTTTGRPMGASESGHVAAPARMRILGDGIQRWDLSTAARDLALPSLSFAVPLDREKSLPSSSEQPAHHDSNSSQRSNATGIAAPRITTNDVSNNNGIFHDDVNGAGVPALDAAPSDLGQVQSESECRGDHSESDLCEGVRIVFQLSPSTQPQRLQQTILIQLPEGTSFYGTGEVGGALERTKKRVFAWNTDSWGYSPGTPSLYQSHPWVFAVLPGGRSIGFLADTTRRCEIDLRTASRIKFRADAHFPLITFGPCTKPADVLRLLSLAIGPVSMPPMWAVGYHQCRWSYTPASRVLEVAKDFRSRNLPCDVIWMDIDYMDGFRCFTFDPETFEDPTALADALHVEGFKAVWMLDPGIKNEAGYSIHDSGAQNDVWVLTAQREPFVGDVWPGHCKFPDYTMKRAREWWAALVEDFCKPGAVDGIWNDMNEPAVFRSVTKTMPNDNIHRGDTELGGEQHHTHYHNVYGMLMAQSTYQGFQRARPHLRPFVLTRAGYMGSQRYAATWTGDNLATWSHLHMSIPMALNLALSGQPFSGPDIGGFAGDATPRLFGRWMGIGALLPFARAHSEKGTRDHEPWVFGPQCEDVCRRALERRYRLIPHLYTLFYQAHTAGTPVISPLFFADPKDPEMRKEETSFMLGPLLVAASTSSDGSADPSAVRLPLGPDSWRCFSFNDQHPDLPLLYLRTGSILPCSALVHQSTQEFLPSDALLLFVALDPQGHASGVLFEDAGDGFGFQKGEHLITHYKAETKIGERGKAPKVVIEVEREEGKWIRPQRTLIVRLLLDNNIWSEAQGSDGSAVTIELPTSEEMTQLRRQRHSSAPKVVPSPLEGDRGDSAQRKAPSVVSIAAGDFSLRFVPRIGGRMISMLHVPSGQELLEGRFELGGYEEYCGTEYRSAGCTEVYLVTEHKAAADSGEDAQLTVEGDVGGGLLMRRTFHCAASQPNTLSLSSRLEAAAVGAGSGGFSRVVCLRIHPSFRINPTTEGDIALVRFQNLKGETKSFPPEFGEVWLRGHDRPAGQWELVDFESCRVITNKFNIEQVETCFIHWGGGYCNMELLSEERPVSKESPITISHSYTVSGLQS